MTTRQQANVGPGCYDVDRYYNKQRIKACAVKIHKPTLSNEANYDVIDYSRVFQPKYATKSSVFCNKFKSSPRREKKAAAPVSAEKPLELSTNADLKTC